MILKILCIEDNEIEARLIEELLKESETAKFELTHHTSLEYVSMTLMVEHFDAILLDLNLPDSEGLDTVDRVVSCAPNTPIIVLTSLADDVLGNAAIKKGAEDYLYKGDISGKSLVRALTYAIERRWKNI